ncbi:MAG TPA: cupin domain-containing protein [Nevskiales bacterium]|nr:cupin domain-containing protein [Nevskiales bacterium]
MHRTADAPDTAASREDGLTFDLGARLRAIREAHGLSQRELARRAGVTNGIISLIEQNKSSPSVASLKRVLDGIPMTLAEFFALELPPQDKVFYRADELLELTKGPVSFRQVGDMHVHNLQILHERYAPGADTGKAMLRHEAEEGGIVIRGQIELTVGDQKRILGPGDAYLFDSRLPHRFRNVGQEECEIISACTPPYL